MIYRISENAIPFLCHLMIPQNLDFESTNLLISQLKEMVDSHSASIVQGFSRVV